MDIEERTLGTDPAKLDDYLGTIVEVREGACFNKRTGRRIRAIVPMHPFGYPVDMCLFMEIAHKYHLTVIEDSVESLDS
jgi:perosamine synthetase